MTLKEYSGNAPSTRLAGGLASGATTSFAVITGGGAGYPTGGTAPFVIVVDPETAFEEKILVTTRTTDTFSTLTRGYDGTTDQNHSDQAVVRHVWDAVSATEATAHANNVPADPHNQYLLKSGFNTAHDLEARHTFGAALGAAATPADTSDAGATGSGANPAREDHVHKGVVANDAWVDFLPTVKQVATFTVTFNYAKYRRIGRTIHALVDGYITAGSGSGGTFLSIGLPVAGALSQDGCLVGVGRLVDDSAGIIYQISPMLVGNPLRAEFNLGIGYDQLGGIAVINSSYTFTTNDSFGMSITYEAAT